MNDKQATVLAAFVFVLVRLLKSGLGLSGRPVIVLVWLVSVGFAASYVIANAPAGTVTADMILSALTGGTNAALVALGIANVGDYQNKESEEAALRQRIEAELLSKLSPRERKKALGAAAATTTINEPVPASSLTTAAPPATPAADPTVPTGPINLPKG